MGPHLDPKRIRLEGALALSAYEDAELDADVAPAKSVSKGRAKIGDILWL